MEPVTIGALALGASVFCVGLISALASRKRHDHVTHGAVVRGKLIKVEKEKSTNEEDSLATVIAGGGYGNVANGKAASQAGGH